jgi:Na+:H+ antiporter, NhaA family
MTHEHARGNTVDPYAPAPIDRLIGPLERFLHVEAAAGIVLLACTIVALGMANSPAAAGFLAFWETEIGIHIGDIHISHSLRHWINDGLMVLFFFVIGLEVKREVVLGELREVRRAVLPMAAALGGMIVPAGIYLLLQGGTPAARGWGVPMATDIAFVVGCMSVLGSRVPHGLRIMVLSLAIADDIGAILVIAVGYSTGFNAVALLLALLIIGVIVALTRFGVRSFLVYTFLGVLTWMAVLGSGIHATIAGVVLGLLTPARAAVSPPRLAIFLTRFIDMLRGDAWSKRRDRTARARGIRRALREAVSPLEYIEATLHPWVGFLILPLFALANAGVSFHLGSLVAPGAIAVAVALIFGKLLGVLVASWLAVRLRLAQLPEGTGWASIAGGGALAGIGFTMALFIAELALQDALLEVAKVGIITGSVAAAALGMGILVWTSPASRPVADKTPPA